MPALVAQLNPLGALYTIEFVGMVICVTLYAKAADLDGAPRWLWVGLSAVTYFLTWRVLGWSWLGCVVGQVLLAVAIGIVRAALEWRRS